MFLVGDRSGVAGHRHRHPFARGGSGDMAGVRSERRRGHRKTFRGVRAMTFTPWQWTLAVAAALLVGFSKTGIGGLGVLAVVIFTQIMPAKQATGIVLPLLCFGDL